LGRWFSCGRRFFISFCAAVLTVGGNLTISSSTASLQLIVKSVSASSIPNIILWQSAGSYQVAWFNYIPTNSTTLTWNAGGSALMTLDTSGGLVVVGPFQCTTLNATGYNNTAVATTAANPWFGTPTNARNVTGTVYHNATGVTIIVYVCVVLTGNAVTTTNYINAYIGATSSPSVQVGTATNATISTYNTVCFIVPNGWYYSVVSTGSVTFTYWTEQGL
jgi:hypothetical protein